MTDSFADNLKKHTHVTAADHIAAGVPQTGAMGDEHSQFLTTLFKLMDEGAIVVGNPTTYLNEAIYSELDENWHEQADLALINMDSQLRLIKEFREHEATPDESPQLQTMVEQLWQMKAAIEEGSDKDVFKF